MPIVHDLQKMIPSIQEYRISLVLISIGTNHSELLLLCLGMLFWESAFWNAYFIDIMAYINLMVSAGSDVVRHSKLNIVDLAG